MRAKLFTGNPKTGYYLLSTYAIQTGIREIKVPAVGKLTAVSMKSSNPVFEEELNIKVHNFRKIEVYCLNDESQYFLHNNSLCGQRCEGFKYDSDFLSGMLKPRLEGLTFEEIKYLYYRGEITSKEFQPFALARTSANYIPPSWDPVIGMKTFFTDKITREEKA